MKSKKNALQLLQLISTIFLLACVFCINAQTTINIKPTGPLTSHTFPFGNNTDFGFTGFIYRNIPAFTITSGDTIKFDLGDMNDVDVRRNIYFSSANINPAPWSGSSQGVQALAWVQMVNENQIPLNSLGDATVGNYELTYVATNGFSFPGGGFMIGFGSSPPGTYFDMGNEQVVIGALSCADPSGFFYQRFFNQTNLSGDILDSGDGSTSDDVAIAGFILKLQNNATLPVAICKNATVQLDSAGMVAILADDVDGGSFASAGIASITVSPDNFTCANVGLNSVILTVTDVNGDVSTCEAIVTVEDVIAPVLSCPENITVNNDPGQCAAIVSYPEAVATDCQSVTVQYSTESGASFPVGTTTVTVFAMDGSNNSSSCDFTVTVIDTEAPTIIDCPTDMMANNDPGTCGAVVTFTAPTAIENCFGADSVIANPIVNGGFETGDYFGWNLTSDNGTCGTFAIGNSGVTIHPADSLFDYADNMLEEVVSPGLPFTPAPSEGTKMGVFFQQCPSTHYLFQDVTLPNGAITLCLDLGYNNHSGEFSENQFMKIELRDPSTDTILTTLFETTPLSPLTRAFSNSCFDVSAYAGKNVRVQIIDATINDFFFDIFFDNIRIEGGIPIPPNTGVSISQTAGLPSGSVYPVGTTLVTYTANDSAGNVSTCSFNVMVMDTEKPVAVCKNTTVQLNGSGTATITATAVNGGSTDNCGIASVTINKSSFTTANIGANSVILTVTDVNGNTATCTAIVTVVGANAELPIAICKNATVQLTAAGTASITANDINNGSSASAGIASITVSPNSFTCANVGANSVTLTVTDVNGNVATCTAVVTVKDLIPPVAICKNITINLVGGTATIAAADVNGGSTDNCGIASMTINKSSFTCANVGTNSVVLTVTDVNGNISTCTAVVTVKDLTPPVAVCKNIAVTLLNGTATITAADVNGGSTDNCGIASIAINKSSFTCANAGANSVVLTVTDVNGNVSTCTAIVTVKDITPPAAVCKNISVTLVSRTATITAADVNGGSTDNCGIASVAINKSSFTCANIGANPVILTVTDVNGNVSTCTAIVTVKDLTPPVAVCKNISVTLVSGTATITAADVNGGSTDNCGIASMTINKSTFICANAGPNPVVLTVTDVNGNVSTCTSTVTVVCCSAPVAVCKNISITLVNGTAVITPADIDGGSTATCGLASKTINKSNFTCTNIGANPVVLTVTDVKGSISTCTAIVTVVGAIPAVSISQGILPAFCQGGAVVLTANSSNATSYLWTSGLTTNPVNVYASGTYTVGVTNSYGCKKTASTVVLYNATNLLSAYTIIATGSTFLGLTPVATLNSSSKVLAGGLGVRSFLQKASVINGSKVTAAGTFVKAPVINTLFGGSILKKINGQANITLPSFKSNPYAAGPSLSVPANATLTISDSIFNSITVGSNAKVTFTRPNIYCNAVSMNGGSCMEFTSTCQKVVVRGNFTASSNCKMNTINNKDVVVYCTGNVSLGSGNTFKANAYLKGNLTSNGSLMTPNNLIGLFIAKAVTAHYTNFNRNTVCENCGSIFKSLEETTEDDVVNTEVIREGNNSLSIYPNPSDGIFTTKIVSEILGTINLSVTNVNGQTLFQTQKENSSGILEIPVDLSPFDNGIYFLRIQMGEQLITRKIILNK